MRNLIYPAPGVAVGAPPPGFELVQLPLADGGEVEAWHREAVGSGARTPLIYFHGNGENLETLRWAGLTDRLAALGVPVLLVDYPGYGNSGGAPSEQSLKSAAVAALRWSRDQYSERKVIPCGWSLGAALAIYLAAEHSEETSGIVALSPWTSLTAVADVHFPGWLVALGLRESYDSLAIVSRLTAPMLVVHGTEDEVIPVDQGRHLAAASSHATWVPVEGAGHGDLLARNEVWRRISGFIESVEAYGQPVK